MLSQVFADELLRNQSLRRYLMKVDSVSSTIEKLFVCHFNQGDIASVLEVITTHFIMSDFRFPKLSLAPSMMLLLDPVVFSAPKMFQAHTFSMVSEAIGSGLSAEILAPDMNCDLTALQKLLSLTLCTCLLKCSYNSYLLERDQLTFKAYIQQGTRNKLNQVLSKSDNSWDSYQCKMSSKTKADLLADYIAFMKDRQYIFVDSCWDATTLILDCIIHQAFSQDAIGDAVYHIKENTSAQDIHLLASILKLMSASLLQTIKYLSNSDCLKTMRSASVCEKYDFLISIIDHFQQFKFCLPIQTLLCDALKTQQSNYKVSKSMLGCILVLMALMCLFVFEEGDLVALGSLRGLSLQPCSSEIPSDKSGKGSRDKRPVHKVAAEFRRHDGTAKTCNGEMFLNCILEDPKKLSDYDDLADFLECKTGKNYSKWLNGREVYTNRRYQKKIDLRKKKKETFWNSSKYKKIGKSLKR
uniref:DUF7812 domain-containing protein n=1 Tax=Glycine max TaxID=3847 RepID=K7N4L0_SOYBN